MIKFYCTEVTFDFSGIIDVASSSECTVTVEIPQESVLESLFLQQSSKNKWQYFEETALIL